MNLSPFLGFSGNFAILFIALPLVALFVFLINRRQRKKPLSPAAVTLLVLVLIVAAVVLVHFIR